MSFLGLFGSSPPAPVVIPQYIGLQLQTSSSAVPVPIVYGTNALAPNIIFSGGFKAFPIFQLQGSSGFLGIGDTHNAVITGYYYTANLIFGLCQGPIARIGFVYQDSNIYTMGFVGCSLAVGNNPPDLPNGPAFVTAAKQLGYAGLAYAYSDQFSLGTAASTGTLNFEVHGLLDASSGINSFDADPALMVEDLLTNTVYGVGLPASALDLTTILSPPSGPDSSYQGYCKATGLALSAALVNAETANSIVTRWLQLTNAAPVWSGGKLKVIPYGDTAVATTPTTGIINQPVPPIDGSTTYGPSSPYIKANAGFISDGGVVNASTGVAMTARPAGSSLNKGQYICRTDGSLNGLYVFSIYDENTPVTITYTYTPLSSFTPNTTALYDLTDDDFVGDASADPVTVARNDPLTVANVQRIEILDRFNSYSATPIEVRDQNAIETFGYRLGSAITAHEICTAQTAQIAAQLILQRGLAIRNTYTVKLSWEFGLLEPMDIVTLTDPNLGLFKTPVRITDIAEDQDGFLTFTAEEFASGTATAMAYGTGGASGAPPGPNSPAAPVNPPVLFESPSQLTSGATVMVFGLSGGTAGVADPTWGGCNVFVSYDGGATYTRVGSLTGASYQGVTTTGVPTFAGTNPDTVATVAVSVAESGATLDPSSPAQARALQSLMLVDNEIMAYGAATPGSPSNYAITYLERGLYGGPARTHGTGAPFLELGGPLANFVFDPSNIGNTLNFKFQSFNVFGKAPQDLATCVAYPKFIYGSGLFGPVAQALANGTNLNFGLASGAIAETDDYGFASDPYTRTIDMGLASA